MPQSNRRDFMKSAAAIGSAVWVTSGRSYAQDQEAPAEPRSANEKVQYACIGVGGKGNSDSDAAAQHGDIIAICDVDDNTLKKKGTRPGFDQARQFNDFREMLARMGSKIDGVTISTPDHMHAPATAMAMRQGIACYTQKPLTHTVWEARRMADIAREMDVPTQMGNQGTSTDGLRRAAAILKTGFLGALKEVHVFTNRPIWPQGGPRPEPGEAPPHVHWDLWLGTAPERSYADGYHPFAWRGWWDFGTGALGDMACHTFNMPFAGLNLRDPKAIKAWCSGHNLDSYPQSSKIHFEFANPGGGDDLSVWWYDGGNKPEEALFKGQKVRHPSGSLIVGEEYTMYSYQDYGDNWIIFDNEGKEVEAPEVEFEKSPGHFTELHESITGARHRAMSNFENYGGPLTETILLGNLAVYAAAEGESKRIEWDAEKLEATNAPEVAHIIKKEYRDDYGWWLDA